MSHIQNNASSPTAIWSRLLEEKLVEGDMPILDNNRNSAQAWYIRVMLGFSGWLGALFLMGFVGILLSLAKDNGLVSICIGIGLCALAYALFRLPGNKDFLSQFALAMSLAGQGFVVFGLLMEFRENNSSVYLAILLFEIVLTACIPNWTHRFLTTLAAVLAAYLFFQHAAIFGLVHGLVAVLACGLWWSSIVLRKADILRPVAYALAVALVCTEGGRFLNMLMLNANHGWWFQHGWRVGTSLVNLALLASTIIVLQRQGLALTSLPSISAILAAVLLSGFAYVAPGLSSALLLILIAYSFSDRVLLGIGLFSLLSFVSHYYYQLQATLLYKSIVLMGLAVLLLVSRLLLQRLFPVLNATTSAIDNLEQESEHA
ncbi:DUF4401 domain-containing protein [Undibacterium sp.]|uniref:DUF4401 domain-containing protein n=1 Tax=Undibacterium sp. TaxID=1914977 RepID=UPI003751944A